MKRVEWRWILAAFALYALTIVVYFVVPAGTAFSRSLIGSAVYNHDAVLNAGIMEWGYRSIWTPGLHFFDWPAGFPLANGLAGTENLAGWQLFYSPLRAGGLSVAASYNITLLSSLIVAGLGCAALARRLGASSSGAVIAGFAFAFNPFHIDHAIHIQTMAICWSPLAILGLDIALENRSLAGLAMLGVGYVLTFLCGMYFGVFLSMVIALYIITALAVGRYRPSVRGLLGIAITLIAGLAVLSPLFIHYLTFAASFGAYPHSKAELSLASLPLEALVRTPAWLATWHPTFLSTSMPGRFVSAFPGIVALSLAAFGALRPISESRSRRVVPVLLIIAAMCFLFALGPTVETRPDVTSHWLTALPLPGKLWIAFSAVRWPMRIFLYSTLFIAVLAGIGSTSLMSRVSIKWSSAASLALLALLFIELRPAVWFSRDSVRIADPIRMSDAYAFLAREHDRGGIVELPSKLDSGITTPFATRYAYGSAGHLRGVAAFHGSMFPPVLDSLRIASYSLPEPEAVRLMQAHGITRLVIHKNLLPSDSARVLAGSLLSQGYAIVLDTRASTVFSLIREVGAHGTSSTRSIVK